MANEKNCTMNLNSSICAACPGMHVIGKAATPIVIALTALVIGLIGMTINFSVLSILRKMSPKSTGVFEVYLASLIVFDIIGSFSSLCMAFSTLMIFENFWSESTILPRLVYLSTSVVYLGRMGSFFMTVLLTWVRCAVGSPIPAINDTKRNAKILTGLSIALAIFLASPRFLSMFFLQTPFQDVSDLAHIRYLVTPTFIEQVLDGSIWSFFGVMYYILPLPVLLLLNIVAFYKLRRAREDARISNSPRQYKINPIRDTLLPITAAIVANLLPSIHYILLLQDGIVLYPELFYLIFFCTSITSFMNFWIYCYNVQRFNQPMDKLFKRYLSATWYQKWKRSREMDIGPDTRRIDGFTVYI